MGIEPTRETLSGLESKRFGATADPECDERVNFRGMWGHVRLRRDTSMCETPGSNLSVVGLRSNHFETVASQNGILLSGHSGSPVVSSGGSRRNRRGSVF